MLSSKTKISPYYVDLCNNENALNNQNFYSPVFGGTALSFVGTISRSQQIHVEYLGILLLYFILYYHPKVVGRSWRYCNTRPTRDRGGASP